MRKSVLVMAAWGALSCSAEMGDDVESTSSPVIWNNALLEYFPLSSSQKIRANSTAILVDSADVSNCNVNFCTLSSSSPSMCAGQRFATQNPILPACTAFLVGPRQFATASHCFTEGFGSCVGTSVVFRWRKDSSAGAANVNILHEHIYTCQSVVFDGAADGQDWVIFEVDRDVTSSTATPREPLELARSRPAVGTLFELPQHFAGLPTKYELGAVSDAANNLSVLRARVDITSGSSGAAWIETTSNRVIGVTSRGPTEVQEIDPDVGANCIIEKNCTTQDCSASNNRPSAAPAWHMPKGPRDFITGLNLTRPTDTAIIGDFDGDGSSDAFWYAAGSTPEVVWFGETDRSFTLSDPGATNGTYITRSGDFDGDGQSDILWYRAGSPSDFVGYGNSDRSFSSASHSVDGTYVPIIGDFDGDTRDDIFWYRDSTASDSIWFGNSNRTFSSVAVTNITTTFTPLVGNFDGDAADDIYWYAPGSTQEVIWYGNTSRTFAVVTPGATNGTYVTAVSDFDGDGRSDILWYRPGSAGEFLEYGNANRTFSSVTPTAVSGTYTLMVGDFDGDSKGGIYWHRPADGSLGTWWGKASRGFDRKTLTVPVTDLPLGVGDFDNDGLSDLLLQSGAQVVPLWGQRFTDE